MTTLFIPLLLPGRSPVPNPPNPRQSPGPRRPRPSKRAPRTPTARVRRSIVYKGVFAHQSPRLPRDPPTSLAGDGSPHHTRGSSLVLIHVFPPPSPFPPVPFRGGPRRRSLYLLRNLANPQKSSEPRGRRSRERGESGAAGRFKKRASGSGC